MARTSISLSSASTPSLVSGIIKPPVPKSFKEIPSKLIHKFSPIFKAGSTSQHTPINANTLITTTRKNVVKESTVRTAKRRQTRVSERKTKLVS